MVKRWAGGPETGGSSPLTLTKIMNLPEKIAIIPVYNEEATIGGVVHAALVAKSVDVLVVVDDGSSDNTLAEVHDAIERLESDGLEKPFFLEQHSTNKGKAEALRTGVARAKEIGEAALTTVVFLDADSLPIWSRETEANMKLWQLAIHKAFGPAQQGYLPDIMKEREAAFVGLLAQYIDEIAEPVARHKFIMRAGMYQRNIVTDTVLPYLSDSGGHAGNRALDIEMWDDFVRECEKHNIKVDGWSIEAGLNAFAAQQKGYTSSFTMYGVVNVGSRVKAGGFLKGVRRMAKIHGQAPNIMRQFK